MIFILISKVSREKICHASTEVWNNVEGDNLETHWPYTLVANHSIGTLLHKYTNAGAALLSHIFHRINWTVHSSVVVLDDTLNQCVVRKYETIRETIIHNPVGDNLSRRQSIDALVVSRVIDNLSRINISVQAALLSYIFHCINRTVHLSIVLFNDILSQRPSPN